MAITQLQYSSMASLVKWSCSAVVMVTKIFDLFLGNYFGEPQIIMDVGVWHLIHFHEGQVSLAELANCLPILLVQSHEVSLAFHMVTIGSSLAV